VSPSSGLIESIESMGGSWGDLLSGGDVGGGDVDLAELDDGTLGLFGAVLGGLFKAEGVLRGSFRLLIQGSFIRPPATRLTWEFASLRLIDDSDGNGILRWQSIRYPIGELY
jgi:hypothetical protein